MANITKEERERRIAEATAKGESLKTATAEAYEPEDDGLEEFERPVEKVSPSEVTPSGKTKIRVLPKGDGKIATGHYDRQTNSFTYHKKGDHLFVHPTVAKTQEDNGLVEIVED